MDYFSCFLLMQFYLKYLLITKNEGLKRLMPQHFEAYASPHGHKNALPYAFTFENFDLDSSMC